MADYKVGDHIRDYITLVDASRQPILNAGFTPEVITDPAGIAFPYSIVDVGAGSYEVKFFAAKAGDYFLQLASLSTPVQRFVVEVEVAPDASVAGITTGPAAFGSTLLDLVRDTAVLLGDYHEVVATQDGSEVGRLNFNDNLRLAARSSEYFRGGDLFISQATNLANLYSEHRITDSEEEVLTVTPEFKAQIKAGDMGEITNVASTGFTRIQYVNQINRAIRMMRDEPVPTIYEMPGVWLGTGFSLPLNMTAISRVEVSDGMGFYECPMSYGNRPDFEGWHFDRSTNKLHIRGGFADVAYGHGVKVHGYERPGVLKAWTDYTSLHPAWVTNMAAYNLEFSTGDPRRYAAGSTFKNDADALYVAVVTLPDAGTLWIR